MRTNTRFLNERAGFPQGTRLTFNQTIAPVGWTQDTATGFHDAGVRVTTGAVGTGGADGFNTLFGTSKSSAAHTLTATEMPTHSHTAGTFVTASHSHFLQTTNDTATSWVAADANVLSNGSGVEIYGDPAAAAETDGTDQGVSTQSGLSVSGTSANAGADGSHSHTLNNMDLKFIDVIVAEKN